MNKKLFIGTVPTNKKLFIGTVPMNKTLYVGTVPMSKKLFVGTVSTNKKLFVGPYEMIKFYIMREEGLFWRTVKITMWLQITSTG